MTTSRHPVPAARQLPESFVPNTFAEIEPWLKELEEREIHSVADLADWLLDRSELDSAISEVALARMFANSCHTDDKELEAAHMDYQTVVLPEIKPIDDRLDHKYLDCPFRKELDQQQWLIFDRDVELGVKLFRKENVALEAEEEKIANRYAQLVGAMTVEFDGEERTLSGLRTYGESPDREIREAAWRIAAERRLKDQDELDSVFDALAGLRQQQARNADFSNYRDYMHTAKGRFDYTPEDCLAFHANVEKFVLPVMKRMQDYRKQQLGLDQLRPWDLDVDLDQAPALEPFKDADGHVDITAKLIGAVDPQFDGELRWLYGQGLFDLDTRPHKAPGGYMDTLERRRVPLIFANSGTTHADVETLVHEGGHAFNALFCRDLEPVAYRMPPLEFAEVASMGLEALAMEHLSEVYPEEDARRARIGSLQGIVTTFPWVATIDAFQQWIYTDPRHCRATREENWLQIQQRFSADVDWNGLDEVRAALWQRQLHLYQVPFYYIEYAIAQMGALQLWIRYRQDPQATVADYKKALSLGGSKSLPQLFEAAGIKFDPRGDGLGEWMQEVESAWRAEVGI